MKKKVTFLIIAAMVLIGQKKTVFAEERIPDLRGMYEQEVYEESENSVVETQEIGEDDKIHFISIERNNDAILLESNGKFAMVDSGEKDGRTKGLLGCTPQVIHYLEKVGVDKLEFYIATHAHSDHIANAEQILERFSVDRVYVTEYKDEYIYEPNNRWDNQWCYDNLIKTAQNIGAEIIQDFDEENTAFAFGDFKIQICNYERKTDKDGKRVPVWDDNVNSLITLVTLGENTAVLTGDATPASYASLPSDLQNVSLLKLAHHGDPRNTPIAFLEKMNPQISVQTGSKEMLTEEIYQFITSDGREYFSTLSDTAAIIAEFPEEGIRNLNVYAKKLNSDLFYEINGEKYCFDENGRPMKGVCEIEETSYLFDERTGKQKYGLHKINGNIMLFDLDTGVAWKEKWYQDKDGKYYFFDKAGHALCSGWYDIEGVKYYFDSEGIWIPNAKVEGWQRNGVGWWYRTYDGKYPYNAWKKIGGRWYYFNNGGYMVTGWQKVGNTWYYLEKTGAMKTGWLQLGKYWYYLDASGAMQIGWKYIGRNWYYFQPSGVMVTGKQRLGGNLYEFTQGGQWIEPVVKKGQWICNETGWWYQERNGSWPYNCWKKIDGVWYWFNNYGYRWSGWLVLNDGTYYMDEDGKMSIGWTLLDGVWYRFNSSGRMVRGNVVLEGDTYYFNQDGQLQIGWFEYKGSMVYSNRSGIRVKRTGWNLIDEKWYYLEGENCGRHTGWLSFNEGTEKEMHYYMDENGVMLTGKQVIAGVEYCFSSSGLLIN